ncbi:uncharacterized protein LOC113373828 [Ctenocephalides felis]|uniref:uncharacterized protein LOC113373828 n=1 Tax=Ctenocephalides felis TaxID=7515 RepID=UPI000E6E54FD|nr:uncharacterized protein LOC113373828 [Ctenocephalides felis]
MSLFRYCANRIGVCRNNIRTFVNLLNSVLVKRASSSLPFYPAPSYFLFKMSNVQSNVRTVFTQCGHYTTVDDENIVIIKQCPSPQRSENYVPITEDGVWVDDAPNEQIEDPWQSLRGPRHEQVWEPMA